jgi:NAD(P)-dependent dehydrogenase (short-subunit alcohol dehydrogenase family)
VGKCVVVTGGSKGIGEGCARVFFEAGANLVICSRTETEGNEIVSELMAHAKGGQRIVFVKCDVSKVKDLEHLITETMREFGRIDCLINNAGWHPPPKTIDDFSIEEMQDLFQLNFISYFAACKFALPHIRKTKGNIINMGSWVGGHGQAQAPTYTATKGAITSFSKGLAIDEAEHGVRVNIVSPGWSFRVPSLLNQRGRLSRACLHGTCTLSCPVLCCAWCWLTYARRSK